jgi:methylthioribose-1-phosphate isomerase
VATDLAGLGCSGGGARGNGDSRINVDAAAIRLPAIVSGRTPHRLCVGSCFAAVSSRPMSSFIDPATLVSVAFDGDAVVIIDQTLLPDVLEHRRLATVGDLVEAIVALRVRGAPAIGIAGAYGIALALRRIADQQEGRTCTAAAALRRLAPFVSQIRESRPTAVNLAWAVDRVMAALEAAPSDAGPVELAKIAQTEADAIRDQDAAACQAMALHAQRFINDRARVLTHCNTGFLCTGGIGTALGAIRVAHEQGKISEVIACETRPLLQGARLTAWELGILGIPHALTVDGAAAGLIARGEIDVVVVGADRIASNGDTANKVGTYAHALAAKAAGIPFVVVAPMSTVDPSTATGSDILIEERSMDEVRVGVRARNPAFDVTPANLITAIITETGVHEPPFAFERKRPKAPR